MAIESRSTSTLSDSNKTSKATTATTATTTTVNCNNTTTITTATTTAASATTTNRAQQLFGCVCANANLLLFTLMLTVGKCCSATPTTTAPAQLTGEPQLLLPAGGATLHKQLDGKGILNIGFKFLNVSGKIGTPLDIGEKQATVEREKEKRRVGSGGGWEVMKFVFSQTMLILDRI